MTLAKLSKVSASTVIGIDASTNSVAFCLLRDGKPERYGKILLNGSSIYEKIADARNKIGAFSNELKADYIAMEGAIMVKSADAVIKLSYIYGVVLAELMQYNAEVITVAPISWQSYIGNKNLTNDEKNGIKITNPGKTDSWYKTKQREIRKQRTVDWVKRSFGIELDDFDVADAFGIAFFAHKTLTEKK
jgi:Holliday junction resolvasome RuvABC endonuclease subunit